MPRTSCTRAWAPRATPPVPGVHRRRRKARRRGARHSEPELLRPRGSDREAGPRGPAPTPRSAPACSSARAPSSTTSPRCTSSSGSPRAANSPPSSKTTGIPRRSDKSTGDTARTISARRQDLRARRCPRGVGSDPVGQPRAADRGPRTRRTAPAPDRPRRRRGRNGGTRQLATVLDHVEAAGGKLVLVGDDRQLAAIDAGGAFGALARRGLAVELTENRRQRHAWERRPSSTCAPDVGRRRSLPTGPTTGSWSSPPRTPRASASPLRAHVGAPADLTRGRPSARRRAGHSRYAGPRTSSGENVSTRTSAHRRHAARPGASRRHMRLSSRRRRSKHRRHVAHRRTLRHMPHGARAIVPARDSTRPRGRPEPEAPSIPR